MRSLISLLVAVRYSACALSSIGCDLYSRSSAVSDVWNNVSVLLSLWFTVEGSWLANTMAMKIRIGMLLRVAKEACETRVPTHACHALLWYLHIAACLGALGSPMRLSHVHRPEPYHCLIPYFTSLIIPLPNLHISPSIAPLSIRTSAPCHQHSRIVIARCIKSHICSVAHSRCD